MPTLLSPFGQRLDKRGALADTFGGVTRSMDPAMADPFQHPSPISMGSATSTARRGKMIVGEMSEIFIL